MAGKRGEARERLLDAASRLIRERGYAATSVDELCAAAGVTKGAFFHHFKSKEDLAIAAAAHFATIAENLFASAPFRGREDPMERILGYLDFRREIIAGEAADYTCLLGTLVQETHASYPAIRDACAAAITGHAATLEADFEAVIARLPEDSKCDWTAKGLALHTQAVLQGAFILAKATNDPEPARQSVDHLRHYLNLILMPPSRS